ncbi:MAG: cell division protein ZapA [Candidatus Kapabacteria bacterium]|nr:cell division protein ZapA [Candidatus Kapabacteria bacterium]
MVKTVKFKIGGKDYSLKGDDEALLFRAANEVNNIYTKIQESYPDESISTISVLTALNIAEKSIKEKQQIEVDESYLVEQINKMTDYLSKVMRYDKLYENE